MKKLRILLVLIATCLCSVVGAQTTYTGSLTNVQMNGSSYNDVDNVTFTLTPKTGNTYSLVSSAIGPIGKMPGTINVDAEVTVDANGNISATEGEVAGTLVTKIGIKFNIYMTSISGSVANGQISFVLNTYAMQILGYEAFNASVTFNGN